MSETGEELKQPGNVLRHPDGTTITIEHGAEIRKMGIRKTFRETFIPKFSQQPTLGSLIEIPLDGGEYFRVGKAKPGQEKPDSVVGERISEDEFRKLKNQPKVKIVRPDNL